jgi:hypothetical protein
MRDNSGTRAGRFEPLLFAAAVAVATILYLTTKSPVVSAILPCVHGGWNSFRTGLWLLRSDPCRSRARTCFAFYVAAACWNAAVAALVTGCAFCAAQDIVGLRPNGDVLTAITLVMAGGIAINALVGPGAICAALRCHVRVWVHPRLRTALHGDLGSVTEIDVSQAGFNHAVLVVATALAFPALAGGAIGLIALTAGKAPDEIDTAATVVLMLVAFVGGPVATIACYAWLSSRVIARSPRECWPPETLDYRGDSTDAECSDDP